MTIDENVQKLREQHLGKFAQGIEITGREDIQSVLENCHPAFGGKLLRKAYQLIREAIHDNYTIFASVAGPITASDYSRVWMVPFIKSGYISAFVASDAISYHDAHDAVEGKRDIHDVDMHGDDTIYKEAGIIRITDIGFPEEVLFNTDKFMTSLLQKPEFQCKLTTTEYRNHLGKYIQDLEQRKNIPQGLLAAAYEYDVPAFCASPADGSTFLNAMKLQVMQTRLGEKLKDKFKLEIDLYKDVYEACALHKWGQEKEGNRELAYIVCGGGASKNYLLQPEPALEQILFVQTKKYKIGVQFTTAPETDGSLSSATPTEAISWGKLDEDAKTVSVPIDYTMVMSIIAHAILKERALYEDSLNDNYKGDKEKMFAEIPASRGFLREPQRLYKKRELAMELLDSEARKALPQMRETLYFE
ncbi:MAG: deoxyhypusine synthase family protein [Nanoarchaeota archaeon]|nr:deoxyhypusine synthase family protein [Nanoarchaeota archaeon]